MESALIARRMATLRRVLPRPLRAHPFLTALAACALLGGGLRFVPASTADTPGSNGAPASTACAAK